MKNYSFLSIIFFVIFNASSICAQTEASATNVDKSSETAYLSDRNARFPNFSEYLSQHLVYPKLAKETSLEGIVKAEVLLNEVGEVTEICIVESMGNTIDAQVIKLLREMPYWIPAVRNGRTVSQRLIVPFKFILI